ncbi:unnamed protein product [Dovyalis caffra]|uniref:Uncharacterized protein n=1 Tax=Dovyalis caffra TaxID=77055 RepID=A0AAV1R3Z6_9ROSI|nr:unnamed protein product [Dovyalis caffra]
MASHLLEPITHLPTLPSSLNHGPNDLKVELALLRITKVTDGAPNKPSKIKEGGFGENSGGGVSGHGVLYEIGKWSN